jgi:hypothetical protein
VSTPREGTTREGGAHPAGQPGSRGAGNQADAPGGPPPEGSPRPRGQARDEAARAALEPLGPNERPLPLLIAVAVCAVLAVGVLVGGLTVHDLSRHGGSLPGALTIALVLALLGQGMWRRRYWAVLSFEALLAFQIIVTSLALVVASTVAAAVACTVAIGLGGWLFWKLVRVMGRIQAGEVREPR